MRICLASIHPRLLNGQIDALIGLTHCLRDRGHSVYVASAFAESDLIDPRRALGGAADPGALPSRLLRLGRILSDIEKISGDVDLVQPNLPTPGFSFIGDRLQRLLSAALEGACRHESVGVTGRSGRSNRPCPEYR